MQRLLRWTGIVLASVVGLAIVAYALLYLLSERALNRTYQRPAVAFSIPIPTDAASIVEGKRLATIRGCTDCHGKVGEGQVMFDQPMIARVVAPNLTVAMKKYNDAELEAIIRHGVRPDGRSLLIMPSEIFVVMNDDDLVKTMAFLKSLPEVPGPGPSVSSGPIGRLGLATGKFKMVAQLIADTVPPPEPAGDQARQGRYLARSICAGCHGTALHGDSNPEFSSPDLRMVAAYSPADFQRLLRTGVAFGGREVGVMSDEARNHLSLLTDAEIAALYSYLHSMPEAAGK